MGWERAMTILIQDETIPGARADGHALELEEGRTTARELLRARIRREVEHYNEHLPETFEGLVQPEESERLLNGYRPLARRPLDPDAQFRQACAAFERNGFLLIVNDRQVTDLDEPLDLREGTAAQFIKLVPLIGG